MAEKASTSRSLSRRSFLKTTAAAAGVAAVAGTAGVAAYAAGGPEEAAQNKEVIGSCRSNCGGKCPLKVKVRNGKVVKTEPADMPEGDELYRRICVKGLSQPQRLYDPDRLKYPMRRIEGTEPGALKNSSASAGTRPLTLWPRSSRMSSTNSEAPLCACG